MEQNVENNKIMCLKDWRLFEAEMWRFGGGAPRVSSQAS